MSRQERQNDGTIAWLLEENEPAARYLTLRDVLDLPENDPVLMQARQIAHQETPIASILDKMEPEGYWEKPGAGYNPKYRSTVWSLISLAQLGASCEMDVRIRKACNYLIEHALCQGGQLSSSGAPSGTVDCLQGNLLAALLDLGYDEGELDQAFEWMARTTTGEGIAPASKRKAQLRYYAGKCGPGFQCGANNRLPCAWGAVKVLLAFGKLPVERRTDLIDSAIDTGIGFIFSVDPATGGYPTGYASKPSRNWWRFGFPVFYVTDLLQIVEAMSALGYAADPRLANAIELIRSKADPLGRWSLEYDYTGKMWVNYGQKKQPNKWVTIRALRALKVINHGTR